MEVNVNHITIREDKDFDNLMNLIRSIFIDLGFNKPGSQGCVTMNLNLFVPESEVKKDAKT